jgi:hypothetical protein
LEDKEVTMPDWGWIVIAVVVIAVIAVLAVVLARPAMRRKRSERLKGTFGPEYERTVAETGDRKAAEAELAAREQKRKKLDIVALSHEAGERYALRWRSVQTAFVDDPAGTLVEADRLVIEVMNERGYPVDDFDQRAADISVDHPQVVENYRAAHEIHLAQQNRQLSTEEQRQAFVHYRALFERLLDVAQHQPHDTGNNSQEARA